MPPHEHLLKRMNLKPETYTAALAILASVQARTGPGSGYNLGPLSTGLPALCAYVASQQLRNNDMSAAVAQQTSCLKPRDFARTLGVVHTVLAADPESVVSATAPASGSSKKRRRAGSPGGERVRAAPGRATVGVAPGGGEGRVPAGPARRASPMAVDPPAGDGDEQALEEEGAEVEEEEEEEGDSGRRFRPVFLDRAQWAARDPRLESVWRHAAVHRDAMVGLYGHPFERCRPRGIGANA